MPQAITKEEFTARVKKRYAGHLQVLEYSLMSKPALFKCTRCGSTWYEKPSALQKRTRGGVPAPCKKCDRHLRKLPGYRQPTPTREEHEQLLEQLYAGRIRLVGPYERSRMNTYRCDNPEHPAFQEFASQMEQKKRDCARCKGISRKGTTYTLLSQEQFIARVRDVHGDAIEVVGKYTGMNRRVEMRCRRHPEHGTWTPLAVNLVHEKSGCPKCVLAKYEAPIAELLTELKVPFAHDMRHGSCVSPFSDKPLRYDFIIEADQIVFIELDGVQHFADIAARTSWNSSLEAIQTRDRVKDDYVRNIGGVLIRASNCRQATDRHISMDLLEQLLRKAAHDGQLDTAVLAPYSFVADTPAHI